MYSWLLVYILHRHTSVPSVSQYAKQESQKSWRSSRNWSRRDANDRNIRLQLQFTQIYMYIHYTCACMLCIYMVSKV